MFVAVLQGGVGYVQYFTGVPEFLVGAHIAGATTLWAVTVWLALGLNDRRPADGSANAIASAAARSM
jgi:cytochrome c oxidase assembly protein subunit 15